jgi:alcohol dehydrogenase class IV
MIGPLRMNFPGASWVGPGAIEKLGEEAADLGGRALLVTGGNALCAAGTTDRIVGLLREVGVEVVLFESAPPEPDVASVDAAREVLRGSACDLVIEAGGGSAIDVGKAAAALAGEDAATVEFLGGREILASGVPHIAIATTSGTGAEVTRNSVLTDPAQDLKKSIRGDGLMPNVSITDGDLTLSCPKNVTAASGMDALVQGIESLFSRHATTATQSLSLGAVGLISQALPLAYADGEDRAARAAMAEGSWMAGLALGSARLGGVHALAHPLGVLYHMSHGVVCALLMEPVLVLNTEAVPAKYEALAAAMGDDPLTALRRLLRTMELPVILGDYPDADWERRIIEYAVASGSGKANPVVVDEVFVREVLERTCASRSAG